MPIHDLGYRPWSGRLTSPLTRWYLVADSGIRLGMQSRWVKRILLLAWLPVVYWGVVFFLLGQTFEQPTRTGIEQIDSLAPEIRRPITEAINGLVPGAGQRGKALALMKFYFSRIPIASELQEALTNGTDDEARNIIWSWLLMTFFRYPQGSLILFLVGSLAPALISQDIRSRAFLLYFSRPIGRLEYIAGKLFIPTLFIVFVTTLPALVLYFFGIMMSPDFGVFWTTWGIPLKILLATMVLVLPTVSLALMFSSLTQESRFASFAWFAVWALGHGAWLSVVFSQALKMGAEPFARSVMESESVQRFSVLSLYNNLGQVQSWIFGFATLDEIWPAAMTLVLITVASMYILFRRVSAPIRV